MSINNPTFGDYINIIYPVELEIKDTTDADHHASYLDLLLKYDNFHRLQEKLALQYYSKLQSCPSNPAFECTIDPKYKELFARKESAIPSFGIRIQSLLDASNILNDNVHATVIPQVPPWTMHHPKVCLDLSVLAKKDTPSHVYIQKFNEIKDQYSYCIPIYTDGSKDNDRVGCGLIINNLCIKQRLPSNASIFYC